MSARRTAAVGPVAGALGLHFMSLLAVVCAWLAVLGVKLGNAPVVPWEQLVPLGLYAAGVPVALVWLKAVGWRGDAGLVGAAFLLAGVGLTVQFRMGGFAGGLAEPLALLPFPLGLAAFAAGATLTARGRGEWLRGAGWLAYLAAVGVLAAMLVLGRRYRGGVYLAGNLNPSEVVKPLLALFLAAYLGRRGGAAEGGAAALRGRAGAGPSFVALAGLAVLWAAPAGLAVLLRDLGLVALLSAVLLVVLFAAARSAGYLALGLAGAAAAGYGAQLLSAHARARFDVWLNPYADPTGRSWQILQALAAMYSGGWWGAGLGSGAPQTVPIVTSDFVYAALAEEVGLAGCGVLLAVYAVLFSRGFRAGAAARTPFGRLLGVGLTAGLAAQTVLNVAGVTKALPMTGITLPLISHGGSSLVTTLFTVGLLAGLSDSE